MFFLLWPLFARAPRHWFLENFLLSAPGLQSVFFVALRWAPRPFGGARAKKKHHQGVFFLLRPRGKAGEGEAPCRHGARAKKKNTTQGVFFCCGPGERQGNPLGAGTEPEQKKKKHPGWCFFFALAPCRRPTGLLLPLPFAVAAAKKKTLGGVFFFCSGPVPARGFSFPCLSPGPEQKKNTLGGVFFFAAAPRGRSLTHCGPGWRCLPLAGVVFFVFAAAPPGPGWCFFFAVAPPGRSLTHCGLGRFRQGPGGVFFFAAAPPGLFRQ